MAVVTDRSLKASDDLVVEVGGGTGLYCRAAASRHTPQEFVPPFAEELARTELLGWDLAPNPARVELGMAYAELPEPGPRRPGEPARAARPGGPASTSTSW